jgi:Xaa-Pro aminopeptidase
MRSTISAYGPHGAVIHYRPSAAGNNGRLGRDSLHLVDSGGQYLDGTTDVTRVFHYGTPTPQQVARYTDVLKVCWNQCCGAGAAWFSSLEPKPHQNV